MTNCTRLCNDEQSHIVYGSDIANNSRPSFVVFAKDCQWLYDL